MRFRFFQTSFLTFSFLLQITILMEQPVFPAETPTETPDRQELDELSYTVEVKLSQVVARVMDKNGRWVGGLKPEDLELMEDGKVQPIEFVDELQLIAPESGAVESGSAPALPATDLPASLILVVDGTNSGVLGLNEHKKYVVDFLSNLKTNNLFLALAILRGTGNYEFLQDFTKDRNQILSAIRNAQGTMAGYEDRMVKTHRLSSLADQFTASPDQMKPVMLRTIRMEAEQYAMQEQIRASNTTVSLRKLFSVISHVPGNKNVLLISEGLDSTGSYYYEYAIGIYESLARGGVDANEYVRALRMKAAENESRRQDLQQLIQSANASGLAVYWINPRFGRDISTISAEGNMSFAFSGRAIDAVHSGMRGLAEETGGEFLRSDPSQFYKSLEEAVYHYYIVSYKPDRPANDGAFHRISLRAKRGDFHVALASRMKDATMDDRILEQLAAVHDFPQVVSQQLPIVAETQFYQQSKDVFRVFLRAGVAYADVDPLRVQQQVADDIHFSYVIRDQENNGVFFAHRIAKLRSSSELFQKHEINRDILEQAQETTLKSGTYTVSVAVMDTNGWRTGGVNTVLQLPGPAGACLSISPLMLTGTSGSRVEPASPGTIQEVDGTAPVTNQSAQLSVQRRFTPSGTLIGFYQLNDSRQEGKTTLSLVRMFHIYGQTGKEISQSKNLETRADSSGEFTLSFFAIPYKDLPAGQYELELEVHEKTGACRALRRTNFEITNQGAF